MSSLALVEKDRAPVEHNHLSFAELFRDRYCLPRPWAEYRRYWPKRGVWMAWEDPLQIGERAGWSVAEAPQCDMARIIEDATDDEDRDKWLRTNHIKGALSLTEEILA